jgi:hypothetical protein
MTPDLLGDIGGIKFVTAKRAFEQAISAHDEDRFGRPDSGQQNGPRQRNRVRRNRPAPKQKR